MANKATAYSTLFFLVGKKKGMGTVGGNHRKRSNTLLFKQLFTVLGFLLLFGATVVNAATITSTAAGGNWNAGGTWVGGAVPATTDDVIIVGTATVTVTANTTIRSITFNNTSTAAILSVNSGVVLNVTLGVALQSTTSTAATIQGLGTLNCASVLSGSDANPSNGTYTTNLTSTITNLTVSGNLTVASFQGNSSRIINAQFNLASGTLNLGGQIIMTNEGNAAANIATFSMATGAQSGSLNLSNASPFNLVANGASITNLVLNGTNATVNYNGTAQTVRATTYTNLTLSGSAVKTISATPTVNGILSLEQTATTTGTTPTFGAASTLQYKGSAPQTTGTEFPASFAGTGGLIINNASGVTLAGAKTVSNGDLSLTAGTLTDGGNILTLGGNITGTGSHSGAGKITMNGSAKTISGATLGNLELNNAGGFSLIGNATVTGTLTLTTGNLNLLTNNLTVGGISVASPSATKMIIASGGGEVRKTFTSNGSFTFPIGDNTGVVEYSPVTVNVSGDGFSSAYVGASVVNAKHTNNSSNTNFLTRYWNLTQSGITNCTATITGSYLAADIVGTETAIDAAQLNGTFNQATNPWTKYTALVGNTLLAAGAPITAGQVSAFTGISSGTPTVSISGGGVTVCAGTSVGLIAAGSGGIGSFVYSWSPTTGLSSSTIANPSATPTTTTTYTVTARDANGIPATNNTTITVNPRPTSVISGSTTACGATVSIALTGTPPWTLVYFDGTTSTPVGGILTSPYTFTPAVSSVTYTVTALIDANCVSQASDRTGSAVIGAINPPTITSQPSTGIVTGCPGEILNALSVTVNPGGSTISSYQWYSNITNTNSGGTLVQTTSTSATSDSYTPPTSTPGTLFYYVVVTTVSPSCSVTSDISGSITVDAPPSISAQPSDAGEIVCQNDVATALFVTATGSNLIYEWFRSNDAANNTLGDDVSVQGPSASSSFTPPTDVAGTRYYYTIVYGSCLPEVTSSVSGPITVNTLPTISVQPSTASSIICLGATAPTLSVTAAGTGLTYQWYTNTTPSNVDGTPVVGETASTFVPSTSLAGTSYYYCEVKSSSNCIINSNPSGAITVPLVITSQPAATQALVVGGSVSFTVGASAGSTFQWRKNGVDLTNGGSISGATGSTLTINPAAASDAGIYSVVVSNAGCGVSITSNDSYLTSAVPGTQASNIVFSSIQATQMTLTWTNGAGTSRIVVAHSGSAVSQTPTNTVTYTANTVFGSGDEITPGSGNYVVYNGNSNSVIVFGLSPSVNYYFEVFEYNGSGTSTSYLTTTATNNPNNQTARPNIQSSGFNYTNISPTGMTLDWSSTGNGTNRIVVARAGGAPSLNGGNPLDGALYTANGAFGNGTQIGTGNYVVYNGSGNSVTLTNLTQATTYHFNVYEYSGSSASTTDIVAYMVSPLSVATSQGTPTATGPSTQATNIAFSAITSTSLTLTWLNGNGQNRMVVGHAGSAVNSDPVDGNTYTANTEFGNGTQLGTDNFTVFNGSGNTVTVTGLTPSTTYYFKVYEYNNVGVNSKYSTFSATNNPNNQSTRPSIQATAIGFATDEDLSDQVTVNWTNGNGTSRIVLVHQNAAVNAIPLDGNVYIANATYGSGSQIASGNYVVYNGTGNSVTVTGLDGGSDYFFQVFEYSGANAAASSTTNLTEYLTSTATGNPAVILTPGRFAYRSKTSGDWSNSAIWQTFNVKTGLWVDTNKTPKKNNNITISQGDLITISASHTSDQIVVNGTLQINSGGTLTVDFNTKQPYNLSVGSTGKLDVHGTYAIKDKSVTLGHSASNTHFFSTGIYDHQSRTEGIVPLATWDAGSTLRISGYNGTVNATSSGNWSQSFSNVVFACNLGGNTVDMKGLLTNIGGDLTVNNTGNTGRLLLNGGTLSPAITIGGNVNVTPTGGLLAQLVLNGSTGSPTVNINGNINMSSTGTFSFGAAGALGTATVNLKNNLTNAGTLTNSSASGIGQLNFTNGTTAHTFSNTGTMSGRIHVTVASANILDVGTSAIMGTGNFTLSPTATLRLGSTDTNGALQAGAVGGNLRNTGTRTFGSPSTIEFNSTSAQWIGTAFPSTTTVHLLNSNPTGLTAPAATLTLAGDFTNNGPFVHNSGTVAFASTTNTKEIKGSVKVTFNNLTINAGNAAPDVRLENTAGADLRNVLDVTTSLESTFDADGAANNRVFTLLSSGDSPTVDASVAPMNVAGGQVQGKVTVQRFMSKEGPASAPNIYRYISSPVTNGSAADIQQEIPIFGSFTNHSVCAGCGNSQTMFRYDETVQGSRQNGYRDFPANINTETLTPGVGYVMLVIRSLVTTDGRWDIRGDLNSGTVPITVRKSGTTSEDGWNLIGNPYPSTINWSSSAGWQKPASLDGAIYTTDNGAGNANIQYAYYVDGDSINGGSRFIPSGQAFWVFDNAVGTHSLIINENAKAAGTQTTFFRKAGPKDILRITLVKGASRDETVIRFKEGATPKFDGQSDAYKMSNSGMNLSSITEADEWLAINTMPELDCNQTTKLSIWNVPAGTYKLDFSQFESFGDEVSITLKDNFAKTDIDVRKTPSYEFTVTADANSLGNNRFVVEFSTASVNTQFNASATDVCMGNDTQLSIHGTSSAVEYIVTLADGTEIASTMGNDADVLLTISKNNLIAGQNTLTIKSRYSYCSTSTFEQNVTFLVDPTPAIPIVENGTRCHEGVVTVTASGSSTGVYNWYESEFDTNPIADQHGSSFSTPWLAKSKTYFVSGINSLGCEGPRAQVKAVVVLYDDVIITREPPDLVSSYAIGNQWFLNDVAIPGAVNQYYKPAGAGIYRVEVQIDGCSTSAQVDFSTLNQGRNSQDVDFSAFPNPVTTSLTIVLSNPNSLDVRIMMTDMKGMPVVDQTSKASGDGTYTVNTEGLPTGVYTLHVRFGSSMRTAKIIKE